MSLNKFESFILGSYLDTIGYLNGFMEFNNIYHKSETYGKSANYTHLINIMEFFKIGGFNLDLKLLKASDDSILNIANGKVLIKDKFTINDFINSYLEYFDTLISDRGSGITIINSIKNLKKVRSPSVIEYDENSIGNGATMRACIFGLKYHYKKDLDTMTKWVIETSKLTHNNIDSYISSLIVAILTSMAIHKVSPIKWVDELNIIKKNIKFKSEKELNIFNDILESLEYLHNNIGIYNSSFDYQKNIKRPFIDYTIILNVINPKRYNDTNLHNIGGISEDLIYYAFYTFLNSFTINKKLEIQPNFIYLVMNSSLSYNDSDSVGTLCGFWYGAVFGFKDIPNIKFEDLEFYKEIKKITDNI
ncbi:ADP-ribosylglycohydrolase [Chlorella virus XW01]|nr:ADP-ribosylglycohydrolase [Chlorella virus XW01]